MKNLKIAEMGQDFPDDETCLEWLKKQIYPGGIICRNCNKVTKHYKVTHKPCYVCGKCGNQVYPAAETIFHKSSTPLKTWFEIIYKMSKPGHSVTATEIRKQYGMTYKTAWRIYNKIQEFLKENELYTTGVAKNAGIFKTGVSGIFETPEHLITDPVKYQKRDRTARLLRLLILLYQYPEGLKVEQISAKCSISKRTAYRDLEALESEIGIPVWEEGNRRGMIKGYFLPPIHLTTEEASLVFMAARMMQHFSFFIHPILVSTFIKLNSILPAHLQRQTQNILDHIEVVSEKKDKINRFNTLLKAWLSQQTVSLDYQYYYEVKPRRVLIDPYFIETSLIGRSIYVIAFCHQKKNIQAFKLESIVGEVTLEQSKFNIPDDFDPIDYLESAWGIHFDETIETVKLRCRPNLNKLMLETNFHSTQVLEPQPDGSIIMTLKVRDNLHFCRWVLGWGDQVEVLEPPELRNQIKMMAKSIVNLYPD